MNKANYFLYSFLGLVIFQIFMSMEELYGNFQMYFADLTIKVHKYIPFFPVIQANDQIIIFVGLLLIVIFIIIGIVVFLDSRWSRLLTVTIGCIEILNGGLHIVTSLYFMQYIPGSIGAVGLIIFGFLVILIKPSIRQSANEEEE